MTIKASERKIQQIKIQQDWINKRKMSDMKCKINKISNVSNF